MYQLEEYHPQQAFDRDFPAATTARPVVIREGHTTRHVWWLLVALLLALPANARAQPSGDAALLSSALFDPFFAQAVTSQIAHLPVSSAAGAFTFNFDPATRTFQRRAQSFGLRYVERADTLGRRHLVSAGFSTQRLSFGSIDGRPLDTAPFYDRWQYEDGRVLTRTLDIDIGTRSTTAFGTYALRDTVDVTVVIPFTSVWFRGVSTDWAGNVADSGKRSVRGIGDVQARVKWNFIRSDVLGVAAHAEMRLPTGSASGLVGTGRIHQKVGGVVSARLGAVQWHGTFGYSFRAGGKAPGLGVEDLLLRVKLKHTASNELAYGVGTEWRAHRRITLSAELVGRYLKDNIRFHEETSDQRVPNEVDPTLAVAYFGDHIAAARSHVHLVLGAVGTKYNLLPNTVVTLHGVFGLSDQGLRASFSPVLGLEYAF